MVAVVLWRLSGEPEPAASGSFAGVAADTWYAKAVSWASENGIITGDGADRFFPGTDVTREQFALMPYNYADIGASIWSAGRIWTISPIRRSVPGRRTPCAGRSATDRHRPGRRARRRRHRPAQRGRRDAPALRDPLHVKIPRGFHPPWTQSRASPALINPSLSPPSGETLRGFTWIKGAPPDGGAPLSSFGGQFPS